MKWHCFTRICVHKIHEIVQDFFDLRIDLRIPKWLLPFMIRPGSHMSPMVGELLYALHTANEVYTRATPDNGIADIWEPGFKDAASVIARVLASLGGPLESRVRSCALRRYLLYSANCKNGKLHKGANWKSGTEVTVVAQAKATKIDKKLALLLLDFLLFWKLSKKDNNG